MIKKIVELQGLKKLKLNAHSRSLSLKSPKEVEKMSVEEARREYWKMHTSTDYGLSYGTFEKKRGDHEILRIKKLADIPQSSHLKPEIKEMLEHWLSINNVEEFTSRIYATIRSMYTFLKSE